MSKSLHVRDFLETVEFNIGESPAVHVDHATRFVFVAKHTVGSEYEPERVDSAYSRVIVPVYDWQALKVDEDPVFTKVLFEAGAASPLALPSPAKIDATYWVKNRTHRDGLIMHPKLKLRLPTGLKVFRTEAAPENSILLMGKAAFVGKYIKQGHRRGIIAHDKKGLLRITFLSV